MQVNTSADLPQSPPLLVVRKKATHSDVVTQVVNIAPADEQRPDYRVSSSSHSAGPSDGEMTPDLSLIVQQLSQTERIHDASENESKPAETGAVGGPVSIDVQKTSLMDEFKALRLQVLTTTSQLLSCVSGTWKRGESFRSKLTAIMQMCVALKTSVGLLQEFLQSALSAAADAANSPLVETANTRVRNLQAVQSSIDAYIETLDFENLSGGGSADTQDLKVGGIIHLTKEIPGLVRTFAPVVEHLAAASDVETQPDSAAEPHQSDTLSDTTHVLRIQPSSVNTLLVSETRVKAERQVKMVDQDDAQRNLPEHVSADVCVDRPDPSLQTKKERGIYSDALQVAVKVTSANTESKPAILQTSLNDNDQTPFPRISDNVQVETTSTPISAVPDGHSIQSRKELGRYSDALQVPVKVTSANTDSKTTILQTSLTDKDHAPFPKMSGNVQLETTPTSTRAVTYTSVVSQENVKNTLTSPGDGTNNLNHGDDSERTSQRRLVPDLQAKVEAAAALPPTPPPKLRVSSQYHAKLGIGSSLTTRTATTTTTTTTTGRHDVVTTSNAASKSPAVENHGEVFTAADDKLQQPDDRVDSSRALMTSLIDYVHGGRGEGVAVAADSAHFRFPRASDTAAAAATTERAFSEQPAVVLRRHPANRAADLDPDDQSYRVSESELETPEFRASGVSQTMVDQLEALQRQANAQAVVMHTDTAAGYDLFDAATRSPNPHYQSTLSARDQRLLMFYCDQMTGHWNVLDNAASAFFHCMDRRQPPKVFVSHSKFVIVAGHKMAYLGDVLAKNVEDDNAKDWIVAHSNRLCNSLKMAVRTTKEAALAYPAVREQQLMVDCIKEVTDWAIELKEVLDRLAYIGRPDHVLV